MVCSTENMVITLNALLQNKLRSMPSLVDEAMTHFRLSGTAKNYRLAVHELVDGHPALLYLGLSALRFIESEQAISVTCVISYI